MPASPVISLKQRTIVITISDRGMMIQYGDGITVEQLFHVAALINRQANQLMDAQEFVRQQEQQDILRTTKMPQ